MLGLKASLCKFEKSEIISSIFSDHDIMRLEINYREKSVKKHKHVKAEQKVTKQPIDHWKNKKGKKLKKEKP